MSEAVKVIAIFIAKPGQTEALSALLSGIVEPTRAEAGVDYYDLHQDVKEPRRFVFIEQWASQAALDAHDASPHIAALRARLPALIDHVEVDIIKQIR